MEVFGTEQSVEEMVDSLKVSSIKLVSLDFKLKDSSIEEVSLTNKLDLSEPNKHDFLFVTFCKGDRGRSFFEEEHGRTPLGVFITKSGVLKNPEIIFLSSDPNSLNLFCALLMIVDGGSDESEFIKILLVTLSVVADFFKAARGLNEMDDLISAPTDEGIVKVCPLPIGVFMKLKPPLLQAIINKL